MHFELQKSIQIIERTPSILKLQLSGLHDDWLFTNEGSDTWSPYDVVGHLIHGEKTDWIARLNILLTDDEPRTFAKFDRFAQFRDSQGKSINQLLDQFTELRANNINYLKSLQLTEHQFSRTANHPSLGVVKLYNLLSCWVVHDLTHLNQINRVMAKQYMSDVGPWIEFLSILKEKV